jgi:hypothetical protein
MKYYTQTVKPEKPGRKTGRTYPNMWKTGPDPWLHDQYYAWLKHKSQAAYRGEEYNFTWEDWQYFWFTNERWRQRGRAADCLVLTRLDPEKEWSRSNCHMMIRQDHLRQQMYEKQLKRN